MELLEDGRSLYLKIKAFNSTLFGEFAILSASTIAFQGSVFLVSLVVAKLLGPKVYGLWNVLALILIYGGYLHLGSLNAMNRDVPLYRGKGDRIRVIQIRHVTFGIMVISSLIAALLLLCISEYLVSDHLLKTSLKLMAGLLIIRRFYVYLQIYLMSNKSFGRVSLQQFAYAALFPIITVFLAKEYGINGFILGKIVSIFLISLLMVKLISFDFRIRFDLQESIRLIKIGFPMMGVSLLYGLLTTVDRWVILKFLGQLQLGYYSLPIMIFGILSLLPRVISQQIYPRMAEKYGETSNQRSLKELIFKQIKMAIAVTVPLLIMVYFLFPPFVERFLDAYIPGIPTLKIILIGLLFLPLSGGLNNFLNTVDKQIYCLVVLGLSIIINLVLSISFVKMGMGIEGVAIATSLTYCLYSLILCGVGWYVMNTQIEKTG